MHDYNFSRRMDQVRMTRAMTFLAARAADYIAGPFAPRGGGGWCSSGLTPGIPLLDILRLPLGLCS
jgi:hypothetical protein